METSDISLASNAMHLIGHSNLTQFSDHEVALPLYTTTYADIMTQHRWAFNSAKKALSKLSASPLNEYQNAFQLPSDYLIMHRTYPTSTYKLFEDTLYSNQDTVEIDYLFLPDPSVLPAYVVVAVEYALASKYAIPVTGSRTLSEMYFDQFKDALRRAKFLDSQQAPNDGMEDNPFRDVRAGN